VEIVVLEFHSFIHSFILYAEAQRKAKKH